MLVILEKNVPQVSLEICKTSNVPVCFVILFCNNWFPDINECKPKPCVYGNCTDEINGYSCICDAGYTGKKCFTSKFRNMQK